MSLISRIRNLFQKATMLPETTTTTEFNYRVYHRNRPYMIASGIVTAATMDLALSEIRNRSFAGERVTVGGMRFRVGKHRMVQIETTPRSAAGERATYRDGHSA